MIPWSLLFNKEVLIVLAVVVLIGGITYEYNSHVDKLVDDAVAKNESKWQAAIEAQKAEARRTLERISAENAEKERAALEHSQQLENAYVSHVKSLKADVVAARAKYAAGLRDPGKASGSSSSCPAAEGKANSTESASPEIERRLSPEFTDFLIGEAARADENTAVANTCLAFIHG